MRKQFGNTMGMVLAALFALAVGVAIGYWLADRFPAAGESSGGPEKGKPAEREILYWVAPMDPNYRRDEPGKSPMGMDLVPVYADEPEPESEEPEILYWVAPMDPNYRRDKPGKSPMGMDLVPVYAEKDTSGGDDPASVRISPAVENNLGVRVEEAAVRPLWRRIEATGYVGLDEDRLTHVHMRTEGWVERLLVDAEGERVRKGQLLFEFYSPELVNAQKEFLQEQRRGQQRLEYAAREKLLALGVAPSEIEELDQRGVESRTIKVFAPRAGVVTSLHVREGAYLTRAMEVMSIADLGTVWMQAEIFEAQADWVARGQSAEARLGYLPGEVFSGQVDYVYPILDPNTRTLRVRLRFDNPDERLKPNMYASVTIFGSTHRDALTIPREALIRAQDSDRVIVALGEGRYRGQEVMTGIESGEWVQIIAGLEVGTRVVTSAQFLIDSEASLSGSIRRLESTEHGREDPAQRAVFGSGRVESIDRPARQLIIRHGPIDSLGWPGMTMQFDVTGAVDLTRVQVGQNVHFSIQPDDQGVYLVNMIHLVDSEEDKVDAGDGDGRHD
jgi:Cu(I)/Ag(I) efflux system membrane fusion protein